MLLSSAGAAGNFLASINQLSANAFKSVIDIDVLGSYNTLKATLPYLVESAQKHRVDSNTRKPNRFCLRFNSRHYLLKHASQTLPGRYRGPNHLRQRHHPL